MLSAVVGSTRASVGFISFWEIAVLTFKSVMSITAVLVVSLPVPDVVGHAI